MTGRIPDDHWARRPVLVLDTETTGVDVETAEVASISVGVMDLAAPLRTDVRTEYIAVTMPEEAGAVNGLTTAVLAERARPGVSAADVLSVHAELIAYHLSRGLPLVAANAPFDLTVLDRDCRRHGVATVSDRLGLGPHNGWPRGSVGPVIDPIVLDKRVVKYRRRVSETQGARCLKTLCQVHGCGWDDNLAHTSEYDALQAGRVVAALVAGYPMLRGMSLSALHDMQVRWYAEQARSYQSWLTRQALAIPHDDGALAAAEAKAASVSTEWPIKPWRGCPSCARDDDPPWDDMHSSDRANYLAARAAECTCAGSAS